jgi:hypothetical protein
LIERQEAPRLASRNVVTNGKGNRLLINKIAPKDQELLLEEAGLMVLLLLLFCSKQRQPARFAIAELHYY